MRDMDDICIEWQDLVDAGEIDPEENTLEDYMEDQVSRMIDRAEMYAELELDRLADLESERSDK